MKFQELADRVTKEIIAELERGNAVFQQPWRNSGTGHKSRLDCFKEGQAPAKFGDEEYSKEELTAELGAAYLCNIAGIENEASKKNHVGYLKSWIEVLRNDTTMIIYAAQRAYKATAFILNQKEEQQEGPEYSLQATR